MKKLILYILPILTLFSTSGFSIAQDDISKDFKPQKAEKVKQKKEEKRKHAEELSSLIKNQDFVLEAYSLVGKYNSRIEVSPSINFISIEGDQLSVQTAGGVNQGYNGLGGITINGTITDYKVNPSKNDQISLLIQYSSPVLGPSTLTINMQPDGSARAIVTDNWGGRVTFLGNIRSPEKVVNYKGWSPI